MNKVYSLLELKKIINQEKIKGKKIVLANGCFDLIHVGHIRYLKESKKKGDILIVAINNDTSVRKLKGKGRPLMKEEERAEIVSSFSFVDYVTIFPEINVEKILLTLKPDIHAKGSDYTPQTVPEKDVVKEYGGKIEITGGPKIKSTSEVIEMIINKTKNEK
ncbi:MAG: adenylyltransferase/cytidyltransferase family protein [Candidatus Aminicenantia bacterium]